MWRIIVKHIDKLCETFLRNILYLINLKYLTRDATTQVINMFISYGAYCITRHFTKLRDNIINKSQIHINPSYNPNGKCDIIAYSSSRSIFDIERYINRIILLFVSKCFRITFSCGQNVSKANFDNFYVDGAKFTIKITFAIVDVHLKYTVKEWFDLKEDEKIRVEIRETS
jgi:hypothetical protein